MHERIGELLYKAKILTLVVLPLLGTVAAMVLLWNRYIFLRDIAILIGMYMVTTMGVTIGYHRMVTHQGFQAPSWLRGLILICGVMAYEGQPLAWCATHIKHHAHSDEDDDPHSPLHGFWHAHVGWLFSSANFSDARTYAPHLLQDPVICFVDRWTPLWMSLALLIPFLLGGWTGLLWGGAVRIFLTTHVTWSVNSVCHTFGRRAFETTDESRNQWVIGLLGFGEGWHNNHHAFPQSAFHGLRWWQFDLSGIVIRLLETLGLAWNVQRVSRETMDAHRARADQSRQMLARLRADLSAKIAAAKHELGEMMERPFAMLEPERLEEVSVACTAGLRRLEAIQANVTRATNLKKQRLAAYAQEVSELVARARAKVPQMSAA